MTYEVYRYIFLGGAALTGIMFLCSVLLFVFLKIPQVVNDLTGRTARRAIENIRSQNESTGSKAYKPSAVNIERGMKTDKISPSGRLFPGSDDNMLTGAVTSKIHTQKLENEYDTRVLCENGGNDTTVLYESSNDTISISDDENTLKIEADIMYFKIEHEITYIHTSEIITS